MVKDQPKHDVVPIPLSDAFRDWTIIEYLGVLRPDLTRRTLEELFARGRVRSGGRPVGPRRRLGEIEDLAVAGGLEALEGIHLPQDDLGVEILYEDRDLLAVYKPAGLPVIPYGGGPEESVLGVLVARELASRAGKPEAEYIRPRIVHRIDRFTSGLLLAARTPEAERGLSSAFEARRVAKEYLALLQGVVAAARVTVNCPIAPGRKGKMRAAVRGREAVTEFDTLERFGDYTLVLARPQGGRTHQIRVHAFAMGHPVAGDPLYRVGEAKEVPPPPGMDRLALHAWRLELPEDWPGRRVFSAPLPADFRRALDALRSTRPSFR